MNINRAPVLTLWVAVVAERQGYSWEEALTFGRYGQPPPLSQLRSAGKPVIAECHPACLAPLLLLRQETACSAYGYDASHCTWLECGASRNALQLEVSSSMCLRSTAAQTDHCCIGIAVV